jgi:hypothetical protein
MPTITNGALWERGFRPFLGWGAPTLSLPHDSQLVYDTESKVPELALIRDEDIIFSVPANTTAELDAAIQKAQGHIAAEREEWAIEDSAAETIHERATQAALDSTGLAALFTEYPEGILPW